MAEYSDRARHSFLGRATAVGTVNRPGAIHGLDRPSFRRARRTHRTERWVLLPRAVTRRVAKVHGTRLALQGKRDVAICIALGAARVRFGNDDADVAGLALGVAIRTYDTHASAIGGRLQRRGIEYTLPTEHRPKLDKPGVQVVGAHLPNGRTVDGRQHLPLGHAHQRRIGPPNAR